MGRAPFGPDTPVIVGVGQSVDRIDLPGYHAWSAVDLAARAAREAMADSGMGSDLAPLIEVIATTRTFEDSRLAPAPFGKSDNFPRSVAQRLDLAPRLAIWDSAGGNSPQDLVGEMAGRIARGEFSAALVVGGEAISTTRNAQRQGGSLDFAEHAEGTVEDRGPRLEDFRDPLMVDHGLPTPTHSYAVAETARRAARGESRAEYARAMGELFAPFVAIAAANPYRAWDCPPFTAEDLVTPGPSNRWIVDPYPLRLIARDQVNLGAAVLILSSAAADRHAIPKAKRIYLHGYAKAAERPLMARAAIGSAPAAVAACHGALARAELTIDAITAFDFYSCYPIAVSNVARDGLGLRADDPRALTLTGGLPFFGGPGNNFSLHAIAEAVSAARSSGGAVLVGANGGYLSKYSTGIYAAEPKGWQLEDHAFDTPADHDVEVAATFEGEAVIETYTVEHGRSGPQAATVIARTADGRRTIAWTGPDAGEMAGLLHDQDLLDRPVAIRHVDGTNRIAAIDRVAL